MECLVKDSLVLQRQADDHSLVLLTLVNTFTYLLTRFYVTVKIASQQPLLFFFYLSDRFYRTMYVVQSAVLLS